MITWEYLAGLIDGEGCFGIYPKWHQTRLTIGMNHLDVLNQVNEFLDLTNKLTPQTNGKGNTTYYLQIGRRADLKYVIQNVLPYLIVKKEDALKVMRHIEEREGVHSGV